MLGLLLFKKEELYFMNWKPILRKAKKALPAVMTVLSVAGVVATAVLSAKATAKALEQVETRDDAWKCYIPTALVALATAAVIIGNGVLNRKAQMSLISAYTVMSTSYKQYREKVREELGEDTDKKIIQEIAVENAKTNHQIYQPGLFGSSTLEWGSDDEEVQHLFYDTFSGRYFTASKSRVLQAEIAVNRDLSLGGFVSANDFYGFLGIEKLEGCDEVGWCVCDGYYFLDFDHSTVQLEDPIEGCLEALIIDYDL